MRHRVSVAGLMLYQTSIPRMSKTAIQVLLSIAVMFIGILFWGFRDDSEKERSAPLVEVSKTKPPRERAVLERGEARVSRDEEPNQKASEHGISEFRTWAEEYLAASESERVAMRKAGHELAAAHTFEIAKLIRTDPEQALAKAVPMVIRQDLPRSIVSLLEERVRMRAELIVNGNVPLPGQENAPDFKPYTRVVSTADGRHWNAFVYGQRGMHRSLFATSINGISVGPNMAVADSTVRQLENGERPQLDGREVVEAYGTSDFLVGSSLI
jgi:hypothetical protein